MRNTYSALTDEEQGTLESQLDKLSADLAQQLERRDDGAGFGALHLLCIGKKDAPSKTQCQ